MNLRKVLTFLTATVMMTGPAIAERTITIADQPHDANALNDQLHMAAAMAIGAVLFDVAVVLVVCIIFSKLFFGFMRSAGRAWRNEK